MRFLKITFLLFSAIYLCDSRKILKQRSASSSSRIQQKDKEDPPTSSEFDPVSDPNDPSNNYGIDVNAPVGPPLWKTLTPQQLEDLGKPAELTPDDRVHKEAYDECITRLSSTLEQLANFYGVFLPEHPVGQEEINQREFVLKDIRAAAGDEAFIPYSEQVPDHTRAQLFDDKKERCEQRNTWYSQYYTEVKTAKDAALHISGPGVASTRSGWTFSLNWIGSTDSSRDSWQQEAKAKLRAEEERIAKELGEIPPTDPLSRMVKDALANRTAPKWRTVLEKIDEERKKREDAEAARQRTLRAEAEHHQQQQPVDQ